MSEKLSFDRVEQWIHEGDPIAPNANETDDMTRTERVEWVRGTIGTLLAERRDTEERALIDAQNNLALIDSALERASQSKSVAEAIDFTQLPPATLYLHGMTYMNSVYFRSSPRGKESYKRFREFVTELVPEIDSVQLAGRVAGTFFVPRIRHGALSPDAFKIKPADRVEFSGTAGKELREHDPAYLAGNARTGEMILRLFAALSDEERAAKAFASHNFCLETTCSGWVQSPESAD